MADPLSIAGSVVGITAAGVQASVKLYALAEKVATASQRVTSIADDISSTCAILNQVRELIIPQPDAQGTLKSVFNSIALNDISHALRRCRSSFTEIEALLRRAFEQVGKRPALRSNIELSRFERAKWPFLQPQFDDLRNDLRDAKGNLVLMIAVASLALAQRDGRQRPIHETERLELGSTIVQLQRARPIVSHRRDTPQASRNGLQDSSDVAIRNTAIKSENAMGSGISLSIHRRSVPQYGSETSANASSSTSQPIVLSGSPDSDRTLGLSPSQGISTFVDTSGQSVDDSAPEGPTIADQSGPHTHTTTDATNTPLAERRVPGPAHNVSTSGPNIISDTSMPMPLTAMHAVIPPPPPNSLPYSPYSPPPPPSPPDWTKPSCYAGWTIDHLQGLTTGYGDALSLNRMVLPDQSLERLVKTYTDEGHDVHIAMSELTREQQALIKRTFPKKHRVEVVYVRLQRNITVSSVFGMLNIETLKWIIASDSPFLAEPGELVTKSRNYRIPVTPDYSYELPRSPMRIGYLEGPEKDDRTPSPSCASYTEDDSSPSAHRPNEEINWAAITGVGALAYSASRGRASSPTGRDPRPELHLETSNLSRTNDELADERSRSYTSINGRPPPPLMLKLGSLAKDEEALSQLAEEDGEDIVNELLARWTVS